MIVCTKCGNDNEEGDIFCGSCGAFLEWASEKVEEQRVVDLRAVEMESQEERRTLAGQAGSEPSLAEASAEGSSDKGRVKVEAPPKESPADRVIVLDAPMETDDSAPTISAPTQVSRPPDVTPPEDATEAAMTSAAPPTVEEPAAKRVTKREPKDRVAKALTKPPATKSAKQRSVKAAPEQMKTAPDAAKASPITTAPEPVKAPPSGPVKAPAAPVKPAEPAQATPAPAPVRETPGPVTADPASVKATASPVKAAPGPVKAAPDKGAVSPDALKAQRARSLVAKPVKPTQPVKPPADQPLARRPEPPKVRPVAAPPVLAAPTREIKPGDLICGECGEGNDVVRKFCRRCGSSLVSATVVPTPPVPLWKRIFTRRPKTYTAGQRPGRGRPGDPVDRVRQVRDTSRRAIGLATRLGLVGGLAIGGVVGIPRLIDFIKDTGIKGDPPAVSPTRAVASSAHPDHPAEGAFDADPETWWAEGVKGNGERQTLTAYFGESIELIAVGFNIKPEGTKHPRPHVVKIWFYDATNTLIDSKVKTLVDKDDFQTLEGIRISGVKRVTVEILSVYPALNNAGSETSITRVQFFQSKERSN